MASPTLAAVELQLADVELAIAVLRVETAKEALAAAQAHHQVVIVERQTAVKRLRRANEEADNVNKLSACSSQRGKGVRQQAVKDRAGAEQSEQPSDADTGRSNQAPGILALRLLLWFIIIGVCLF